MRTIERAGELLLQGEEVIIYDCGGDAALLALSCLEACAGRSPTALCDSRDALWGRKLNGVTICGPHEAVIQYPNAWWVIANFLDKAAASHTLEEHGILPEKILNYTSYERRVSCRYLESYLHPCENGLYLCCEAGDRAVPPSIKQMETDAQTILAGEQFRLDTIRRLGQGTSCDQCRYVKESFYPRDRKISLLNFGGGGICNFRCIYCNADARGRTSIEGDPDFAEVFTALKQMDVLSEDIHVQFNAGEIGAHPKRAAMFRALDGATVSVLTNSSLYCHEIADALKRGKAVVNTSLDAGTRETFRKIKGSDAWEKVCSNLHRYAEARKSNVILKYIFLPGVNDTPEEMDGFIRISTECAGFVQISSDFRHPERIRDTTWDAYWYLRTALDAHDILYRVSAGAFWDRK